MKFQNALALIAIAPVLGAPVAALSHEIWVVPVAQDGKVVAQVRYADPGRQELAERGKVVSLDVISASGKVNIRRPLKPAKAGGPALDSVPFEAPKAAVLAVTYDNGFWTEDIPCNRGDMLQLWIGRV